MRAVGVLLAVIAVSGAALAEEEPLGYRLWEYRAPVPETLEGATVTGTDEAFRLWQDGATAFIDVLPRPPKPDNLPEGTVWREQPRLSIPGAMWLPNVGYGEIAEQTAAYFQAGLAAATGNDPTHPVLFFCLADCWMSWNAAKRAMEFGYTDVFWYPLGTDGWAEAGHDLEEAQRWHP